MAVFESKKRLKLFSQNAKKLIPNDDRYDFKHINGGFVYQNSDYIEPDEITNSILKSKKKATQKQIEDMSIAYIIASLTKSNCVTYVKNKTLVAIGMGMTSRVDATKAATNKAKEQMVDMSGCSMASEAFIPFRDTIDETSLVGVACVIQPGGSIRDSEVIEASNEHGIVMYFSSKRHFLH